MHVRRRIKMCLLIEKMSGQPVFSEKIGLMNRTRFHGKEIGRKETI